MPRASLSGESSKERWRETDQSALLENELDSTPKLGNSTHHFEQVLPDALIADQVIKFVRRRASLLDDGRA